MPEAKAVERLLRLVTDRTRASELTGDLLEQHPNSRLRLYLATANLIVAFTWRTPVAAAAGLLMAFLSCLPLSYVLAPLIETPRLHPQWAAFANKGNGVAMLLWLLATFGFIRFSLRDRFTQAAGGLALLMTSVVCLSVSPSARLPLAAATFAAVALLSRTPARRIALASVLASLSAGILTVDLLLSFPPSPNLDYKIQSILLLSLAPSLPSPPASSCISASYKRPVTPPCPLQTTTDLQRRPTVSPDAKRPGLSQEKTGPFCLP